MSIVTARYLKKKGYTPVFLSKYTDDDRPFANRYGICIIKANQFFYSFIVIPFLIFSKCIPGLTQTIANKFFKDVVLFYDIGGITFSKDRGFAVFLIHATWLALPLLLGIPVVKGSQAVGPLKGWYHRLVSIPMLKKTTLVHGRGKETQHELDSYGIKNQETPDIAFLLKKEPLSQKKAVRPGEIIIIPSSMVMKRYDGIQGKGSYLKLMGSVINHLLNEGHPVRLLAHSYRYSETINSNDLPLCRQLYSQAGHSNLMLTNVLGKTPGNLKFILAQGKLVVTGRFHGMVAALGCSVPVIVTSWSHKYKEVLDEFDLSGFALDWRSMDETKIISMIENALKDHFLLKSRINNHLPEIRALSILNFEGLDQYVRK